MPLPIKPDQGLGETFQETCEVLIHVWPHVFHRRGRVGRWVLKGVSGAWQSVSHTNVFLLSLSKTYKTRSSSSPGLRRVGTGSRKRNVAHKGEQNGNKTCSPKAPAAATGQAARPLLRILARQTVSEEEQAQRGGLRAAHAPKNGEHRCLHGFLASLRACCSTSVFHLPVPVVRKPLSKPHQMW